MADESSPLETVKVPAPAQQLDAELSSPAIRRLIEEVRVETIDTQRSYNRTFNRHNR